MSAAENTDVRLSGPARTAGGTVFQWQESAYHAWADNDALRVENARLREAILDIDAHAAPLAINDEHGKLGYIVSVGSLHRALGVIGYTSRKCVPEALCSICKRADGLAEALEELQATVQATCEGGQVDIPGLEILGEALDEADAVLRTYREANRE